jgi:hypothetical protein
LAETHKASILLLKTLLHLMEFNPNFYLYEIAVCKRPGGRNYQHLVLYYGSVILQYVVIYVWFLHFRTLFAQFLAQRIEKEQILEMKSGHSHNPTYMQNGERYIINVMW